MSLGTQHVFKEQSFGLDTGPQLFFHSFIALSITRCSKSAQKFALRVHQVTTVAMATSHPAGSKPILKLYHIN